MSLPAYIWTNVVAGWRPYRFLEPNLRLYDNDFSSATVNWTSANLSGTAPTPVVSGGLWTQTTHAQGLAIIRANNPAPLSPFFSIKISVSAISTGGSNVNTFVGPGITDNAGNWFFFLWNAKTGELSTWHKNGVTITQSVIETRALTAPFDLTLIITAKSVIGHMDSPGAGITTLSGFISALRDWGVDLTDPAVLATIRPSWIAGTDVVGDSGTIISLSGVESAYFDGLSIRETFPVTNIDGSPITNDSGHILVCGTNEGVEFTGGYEGTAHWGLRWYDPIAHTLGAVVTRIYTRRSGHVNGESDPGIIYDSSTGTWHIYQTATSGYPAAGLSSFDVLYSTYVGDLRTAGVVVLVNPISVTFPAYFTTVAPFCPYDISVRFIAGEWYAAFGYHPNAGDPFYPALVKGSSPSNFSTLISNRTDLSNSEGTKLTMLDGVWYLVIGTSNTTAAVVNLDGTDAGTLTFPDADNATFKPIPSIVTEQYLDGATRKTRYHMLTHHDSVTTNDGVTWLNPWQFGALIVNVTNRAADGWDFEPAPSGNALLGAGFF